MGEDLRWEHGERYLQLLADSELLVGAVDDSGMVVDANDAARRRFRLDERGALSTADLFPAGLFLEYYDRVRPALVANGTWRGRVEMLDADGQPFTVDLVVHGGVGPAGEVRWLTMAALEVDRPGDAVGSGDRWRDARTGLAAGPLLDDHLTRALARARRTGEGVGVLVLDVLGHASEAALGRAADAIEESVRPGDLVARLDDRRFVLVLEPLGAPGELGDVSQRCRRAVRNADGPDALDVSMGHTIGRANDDAVSVLGRAEKAAEVARRIGPGTSRGVVGALVPHDEARAAIGAELAVALSHGQLGLEWVPVARLDDRSALAWEVLPLWRSAQLPGTHGRQLFEVARSVDLLQPLVDHLVRRTIAALLDWRRRRGAVPPAVLLDLPSETLLGPSVLGRLLDAAQQAGLPADLVAVKVADDQLARSPELARTVRWMAAEGMPVAVGGLGAGLSSLPTIAATRPRLVELDETLVHHSGQDGRRELLAAVIAAAREMGTVVGAAGVTDNDVAAELAAIGVEVARGRWAGRPVHGRTADRRVPTVRVDADGRVSDPS